MNSRSIIFTVAAAMTLAGCSNLGNSLSGALGSSGMARLVDASPTTTATNLTLLADRGTIDSGLGAGVRIGAYSRVNAGTITFEINTGAGTADVVPSINVNVAASTNYSVVLEGEPGTADYQSFGFQDTNALPNASTVRFKVNNAAPNLATPVDVYIWPTGTVRPATPTVPGLALNQDSGSAASHPGNAYIPQLGSSTTLPAGQYSIAIVALGTVPNGSTDLFDGTTSMNLNTTYSITIEDLNATQNHIGAILSVDEPMQASNQAAIAQHPIKV